MAKMKKMDSSSMMSKSMPEMAMTDSSDMRGNMQMKMMAKMPKGMSKEGCQPAMMDCMNKMDMSMKASHMAVKGLSATGMNMGKGNMMRKDKGYDGMMNM